MTVRAAILCVLLSLHALAAAASAERVTIRSLDGKLELTGHWFKTAASGMRPAVISLHGCNGALNSKGDLNPVWARDAGYFNAEQMHLLVLDSFTPRGVSSICETPLARRRIHEEDRRDDVFAAIQWLSRQADVDPARIAVVGRSHGGSTLLSVLDRSDKFVQAQAIQPKAAIALYPGCGAFLHRWNYEPSAPLLLLAGELDDWTPAADCVALVDRIRREHKAAAVELVVYAGSHHGFDSVGPVVVLDHVASTRSGKATVGGNPDARRRAHERIFEFLAQQFEIPLVFSHDERFSGHRYSMPAPTTFARIDEIAAVPLGDAGRARYRRYLELARPKAFVITEAGGWYFSANDRDAMKTSLGYCEKARVKCWLYAVDDQVVWRADVAGRIDLGALEQRLR